MNLFIVMIAIVAFSLNITLTKELKDTKRILSKYVNEEDKELLNKKQKAGKWTYIFIALHIIAVLIVGYIVFIKK